MGELGEPTEKQLDFLRDSYARINIADGAVRSGKTVGVDLRWIHYVSKTAPPGPLAMWGKTERTLKRNILDPLQQLLGNGFRYNRGEGEAYMFGRTIYIAGANDERASEKIRGLTLAGAYGDELTLTPESFFTMMLSRISVSGAKLFGTTNPDSPYHWLKVKFIDRAKDLGVYLQSYEIDDNPYLDPEYVESLKKEYTGVFYKRFIEGLWVIAEGVIYPEFDENKHVGLIIDAYKFRNYVVGIDYGVTNPCTYGLYGFDGAPPVHLVKEYYHDSGKEGVEQKTDEDYYDDLVEFLGDIVPDCIYVDPSATSLIVTIRKKKKYNVKAAKNDVLPGIRCVGKMIKGGDYYVDAQCRETIKGYSSYVWDPKAQKAGKDEPLKKDDHTCDRDRYVFYSHFNKLYVKTKQKHVK